MSNRAFMVMTGTTVVGLAALFWWAGADELAEFPAGGSRAASAAVSPAVAGSGASAAPAREDWAVTVSDAMGLTLDAARLFELGFAGGLVIDRDTRASLEALVNAMPPNPSPADMERLERTLRRGLPREEADKAFKLVTDYRAYAQDIQREMHPIAIPANREEAKAFFDKMDAMKRRHFDEATAVALFGADDRYARLSMEANFVRQDQDLSPERRKEAIDALRAQLPADRKDLIPPADPSEPAPQAKL